MSKFEKAKAEWAKLDEEEKAVAAVTALFGLIVVMALLTLVVVLIKELFVPALIAVALYLAGARYFGWPVPKKIKQFFVK